MEAERQRNRPFMLRLSKAAFPVRGTCPWGLEGGKNNSHFIDAGAEDGPV
jgi:hypothetical protein